MCVGVLASPSKPWGTLGFTHSWDDCLELSGCFLDVSGQFTQKPGENSGARGLKSHQEQVRVLTPFKVQICPGSLLPQCSFRAPLVDRAGCDLPEWRRKLRTGRLDSKILPQASHQSIPFPGGRLPASCMTLLTALRRYTTG
jgi:hypothetical protein